VLYGGNLFSPSHSLYLETREIAEMEAAVASDTRRRGRGPVGTPLITTGRAPSWLSEENLAVSMAVKLLPNSSIDGANCSAKTTKPPYSSLSMLVVVLVHLIVRSETALVA
jgi:hypothetical protein